jgi:hypothetical protein
MSSIHPAVAPQHALLLACLQFNAAAASVPAVRGRETLLPQEAPMDAKIDQDEEKLPLRGSHRLNTELANLCT